MSTLLNYSTSWNLHNKKIKVPEQDSDTRFRSCARSTHSHFRVSVRVRAGRGHEARLFVQGSARHAPPRAYKPLSVIMGKALALAAVTFISLGTYYGASRSVSRLETSRRISNSRRVSVGSPEGTSATT